MYVFFQLYIVAEVVSKTHDFMRNSNIVHADTRGIYTRECCSPGVPLTVAADGTGEVQFFPLFIFLSILATLKAAALLRCRQSVVLGIGAELCLRYFLSSLRRLDAILEL